MIDPREDAGGPFGINLIGFATANLGLGGALRNTAGILDSLGIPYGVFDVPLPDGRSGRDAALAGRLLQAGGRTPYPINLFHLNPPELAGLIGAEKPWIPMAGKLNVCVPFWELPSFPSSWLRILAGMDMVLAPSRFIEGALVSQLQGVPVRYYPQGLREMPAAPPERARWAIPPGRTVFLSSFELASDMSRKNPMAAMLAFARAFRGSRDALLILKLNNGGLNAATRSAAEAIKGVAAQMGNAAVIDASLPREELLSLYASADVFVSLHRSEGLGLSLMESMCLGKPVIATDWSGNMDFCDDSNACLVRHTLVPVQKESAYHAQCEGREILWAEPDVDEAAAWMRALAGDPALRHRIGAAARESIGIWLGRAREGRAFGSLRAFHAGRAHLRPGPRILIQNRSDMEALPGGDAIVVRNLQAGLAAIGERASVSLEHSPGLERCEVVQLVNLTRTVDTLLQLRNARAQGRPTALISLYEDLDRYLEPATRVDLLYKLLAGNGRPTTPEELFQKAKEARLDGKPLDEQVARSLGIGDARAQQEILAGADWIFTSGGLESSLLKSRFRFDAPVEAIPFGIDPAFRNADGKLFREKYGFRDFALCVGRLETRKNVWALIELFRQWPDKQLVLIGYFSSPEYRDAVMRYAPRNVAFLERLPREEVISAFAAARLHILASWYELPGLVSLEAAAAGSRVVTTSWGTACDWLGDKVHYCEPDDPASIRNAVLEAYDTPVSPELREYVLETFDWTRTARCLARAYGRLGSRMARARVA